jgi:sialate O-acetylesterase
VRPGCKHLGEPCTVHPVVKNNNSDECCGGRCFYYSRPPLWPGGGYCDEKSPSNDNTQLFDNVITPLLPMTIFGAVWYQGESDTSNEAPTETDLASKNYACMMPALVDDWRAHWSAASGTAADFPFGIVQLSAWGGATGSTPATGESLQVAATRWGQSANYGYAPNPKQPRTFMAVALDLGAFQGGCCAGRSNCNTYPGLCIHPWWKQEVGRRLALGAQAVAYNDTTACHQGPWPTSAVARADGQVTVTFEAQQGCGDGGIELRRAADFELRAAGGNWSLAAVTASDSRSVTLSATPGDGAGAAAVAVRYLWSTSPGSHPPRDDTPGNVSVYGKGARAEGLPAPPFFMAVTANNGGGAVSTPRVARQGPA